MRIAAVQRVEGVPDPRPGIDRDAASAEDDQCAHDHVADVRDAEEEQRRPPRLGSETDEHRSSRRLPWPEELARPNCLRPQHGRHQVSSPRDRARVRSSPRKSVSQLGLQAGDLAWQPSEGGNCTPQLERIRNL
jgi:hypothetical protein